MIKKITYELGFNSELLKNTKIVRIQNEYVENFTDFFFLG